MSTNKMFITSEKKEINTEERSIVAWANRPVIDRDGELVASDCKWVMDNFQKNPVLLLGHNYSLPPVGRVLWWKQTPDGMKFKAKFANTQAGEELWSLYKDNFMNAFSIGFIPKKWEDSDEVKMDKDMPRRTFKEIELLEISCVAVPSCAAAVLEADEKGLIKTKDISDAIKYVKEQLEHTKEVNDGEQEEKLSEETKEAETINRTDCSTEEKEIGGNVDISENIHGKINSGNNDTIDSCSDCVIEEKEIVEKFQSVMEQESVMSYVLTDEEVDDLVKSYEAICGFDDDSDLNELLEKFTKTTNERDNLLDEIFNMISLEKDVSTTVETEEKSEIVTKPDTDNYIHIENSTGHIGHKIRTITISAERGIKAHYCVECKEVTGYMFDTEKWTREDAEKWVSDHKKIVEEIAVDIKFTEENEDKEIYLNIQLETKAVMCECPECGKESTPEDGKCGMCPDCNVDMNISDDEEEVEEDACKPRKPKKEIDELIVDLFSQFKEEILPLLGNNVKQKVMPLSDLDILKQEMEELKKQVCEQNELIESLKSKDININDIEIKNVDSKDIFPLEIEEKAIPSDDEIMETVLKLLESGEVNINTVVNETVARMKGKMFI